MIYWSVSGSYYRNLRLHTAALSHGLPSLLFFIFRKSTFFNVLTKSQAAAENFPFCTIDPNESRVPIPDERYDFLCQFHKPARYGVSHFSYYSHFRSVVSAAPPAIGIRKHIKMSLTCSCQFCVMYDCWEKSEASESSIPGYHTHLQRLLTQEGLRFAVLYWQITGEICLFDWRLLICWIKGNISIVVSVTRTKLLLSKEQNESLWPIFLAGLLMLDTI